MFFFCFKENFSSWRRFFGFLKKNIRGATPTPSFRRRTTPAFPALGGAAEEIDKKKQTKKNSRRCGSRGVWHTRKKNK